MSSIPVSFEDLDNGSQQSSQPVPVSASDLDESGSQAQGPVNPYAKPQQPASPSDVAERVGGPKGYWQSNLESLGHTFGIGRAEAEQAQQQAREHPVETAVEGIPAVGVAKGLYSGFMRTTDELGQAVDSLRGGNPAMAGVHAVQSIPFLGPGIAKAGEQTKAPTPGESYLGQVGDVVTSPGALGTLTGTAIQGGLAAEGARGLGRAAEGAPRPVANPSTGTSAAPEPPSGPGGGGGSSPSAPRTPVAPAGNFMEPSGGAGGVATALRTEVEAPPKAPAALSPEDQEIADRMAAEKADVPTQPPTLRDLMGKVMDLRKSQDAARSMGLIQEAASLDPQIQAAREAVYVGHLDAMTDAIDSRFPGVADEVPGAPPPQTPLRPIDIYSIYMDSVKAGVPPAMAAAVLGMTPQHQELAHTAAFFIPNQMAAAAKASAPPAPPAPPQQPPVRPVDPVTIQQQAQAQTVQEVAARAASIQQQAEQAAAGVQPPKPPEIPAPQGMDQGALTQQTVDNAVQAIRATPYQTRYLAQREAAGTLAQWALETKTPIGPDGNLENIDSPKAAQTWAVKIINEEVDRQHEVAKAQAKAQKAAQDAAVEKAKQVQEEADTAQQERDEFASGNPPAASAQQVDVPDTPQTQKARQLLAGAPKHWPAEKLEKMLRDAVMLAKPVRDSLIQDHIRLRSNQQEDAAQAGMTGQPIASGKSREELQAWADGVVAGEHPFVHIPQDMAFKPAGVDKLERTPVKGAGVFNGTYYHVKDIKPDEIRKAARDKTDSTLR